ncbi:PREDICTED: uncharacterized protein LOC104712270 [Camelina sativa]|uniref:Uncharacterized protein LOC104712270 n=1 Tax=Camelina sativa TaxID=90675 RepID=A0ABM0TJS3_CAMSA|nr:PREDICTED: uncharacterized protein LOC104712270 [Camelina sativa]
MSSLASKFAEAEIGVFWDLDDCPIPSDQTPASIYANIKLALKNIGYNGRITMYAYSLGEQKNEDFESINIKLIERDSSRSKMKVMFKDVYMWGILHRDEPTNLMVISDISEQVNIVEALEHLSQKENNILLASPQNLSEEVIPGSSVWLWALLSTGGSPINNQLGQVATPSPSCLSCAKRRQKRQLKRQLKKRKLSNPEH